MKNTLLAVSAALFFAACSTPNSAEKAEKAVFVTFVNHSSFAVDIYKNFNPEDFDPATLVCSVKSGREETKEQYPSQDQLMGDSFYIRYRVQLDNSYENKDVEVYAERSLSNITFVIESGKRYSKTIPQPNPDELVFFHGYIKIQNQTNSHIQIIWGNTILSRLGDNAVYLNTGDIGLYKIPFSLFDTTIPMSSLKAFGNSDIPFPSFVIERGKKYIFDIKNDHTVFVPVPAWVYVDPLLRN